MLVNAPKIARDTAPFFWTYLDCPRDGQIMLTWQPLQRLGTNFASDGYIWPGPDEFQRLDLKNGLVSSDDLFFLLFALLISSLSGPRIFCAENRLPPRRRSRSTRAYSIPPCAGKQCSAFTQHSSGRCNPVARPLRTISAGHARADASNSCAYAWYHECALDTAEGRADSAQRVHAS